ncbi:MAG: sulfotransferase family protein [Planctomycetota bacterium]|nr:MAG: sulfotransferase family protein [Planctomycetota bacterium]MCQ3920750.1 sulfotransferase family protein [Planctomycetota bacterium]
MPPGPVTRTYINQFGMKKQDYITVVSGLPRSGTSMMMSMLEAAGFEVLQDGVRTADEDNPKGYYEFERVKKLTEGDVAWLPDAVGKVVKVISRLLVELPPGYRYKVIWMRRNIDEIIASQKKMLVRRGTYDDSVKDDEIRRMLLRHVEKTLSTIKERSGYIDLIFTNYNKLLGGSREEVDALAHFLGGGVSADAMMPVVDKNLYRNRAGAKA